LLDNNPVNHIIKIYKDKKPEKICTCIPPATGDKGENMGNLGWSYLRFLREFRKKDLVAFDEEHKILSQKAKLTKDYTEVTEHYYSVMASIIETYYGSSFHFCPPDYPKQNHEEATRSLHRRIAKLLDHSPKKIMLDVGCGIGEAMRNIAVHTNGKVHGITLGLNEVEQGREITEKAKIQHLVSFTQGDCNDMPFEDESFNSAYAIYALKYFIDLSPVLKNVYRVLKPGSLFLIYDLVKSDKYDPNNSEHVSIVDTFEYACGMPPLHTNKEMIDIAGKVGFTLQNRMDLSTDYPWYYSFVQSKLLMWIFNSRIINTLIGIGENVKILPKGFKRFNDNFLAGTVRIIVEAGKMGILSGSNILLFQKPHEL
jgi:ubiquinone/menaquinone biosynthesis C-methylase UbiE